METKETAPTALKARLDELKRRADKLAEMLREKSATTENHPESPASAAHEELSDVRARIGKMEDEDVKADDASLVQLGKELDNIYGKYLWWPGKGEYDD